MAQTKTSTQTWGSVFLAELRRIILRPPSLVALLLFVAAAIGLAVGQTAFMDYALREQAGEYAAEFVSSGDGFMGLILPVSFLSFALSIMCVSSTARDYRDGTAAATLVAVPRRTRLLSARLAVWTLTTLVASLAAYLPLTCMYQHVYEYATNAWAELACGVWGTLAMVMVAFACATVVRRGALAMLAFLSIDIIVPMAVSMGGSLAPEPTANILENVNRALPGTASTTILEIGKLLGESNEHFAFCMTALAVWVVVSIVASHLSFARYVGAAD